MATFTDTIKILVKADTAQAIKEVEKAGQAAQRDLGRASKATRDWGATLTNVGAGLVSFSAVAGAGLFSAAQAADEAQQSQLRLENTLRNQPQLANASTKAFTDLASAIARKTVVDDDQIVSSQALLGQFGLTEDQILKLTPLVVDLSAKMGVGLDQAAKAVGKAVDGSAGALKRFGVDIGDVAKGADNTQVVFEGLTRTVGGFAENQAKTFSGQLQQVKRDLGEIAEGVGAGVIPVFQELLGPLRATSDQFQTLSPDTQTLIGRFGAIGVSVGAVTGSFLLLAGQAQNLRNSLTVVGDDGARSLNSLGRAAVGLSAVTAAIGLLGAAYASLGNERVSVDRLKVSVDELAQTRISGVLAEKLGVGSEFNKNVAQAIRDLDEYDKSLAGPQRGLARFIQLAQDAGGVLANFPKRLGATEFKRVQNLFADLDAQLAQLAETSPQAAIAAFGRIQKAALQAGVSTEAVLRVFPKYTAAARALDDAAAAQDRVAAAAERHTRKISRLSAAYDRFLARQSSRNETLRNAATAQLDVADAAAEVADRQRRLTELQQSGTATQDELAQATRDLQRAQLNYFATTEDAAAATIAAAKAETNFKTTKDNSIKTTQRFVAALIRQRDELDGPARTSLERYIAKVLQIPRRRATTITVNASSALIAIQAVTDALNNLTGSTNSTTGELLGAGFSVTPRAAGGPVQAGGAYLVGEQGPELFVPKSSGTIVPNSRTAPTARFGASSGQAVVVNFNGPVAGSKRDFERMVVNAIREARRRGDRDVA